MSRYWKQWTFFKANIFYSTLSINLLINFCSSDWSESLVIGARDIENISTSEEYNTTLMQAITILGSTHITVGISKQIDLVGI